MIELIIAVLLAAGISSLCSTTEAMLYSLSWTDIEKIKVKKPKIGSVLFEMRSNVDKPISAILTLNTVANTAGATVGACEKKSVNVLSFKIFYDKKA